MVVLKELIFLIIWEEMVVLKQLIFNSFILWEYVMVLKRTDV